MKLATDEEENKVDKCTSSNMTGHKSLLPVLALLCHRVEKSRENLALTYKYTFLQTK